MSEERANADSLDCLVRHVGDRVMVFDDRRYKGDRSTPLSVTMRPATIDRLYKLDDGRPVADVRFDEDRPIIGNRLSTAHFVWGLHDMPNATRTDSFVGADGCDFNPKKGD